MNPTKSLPRQVNCAEAVVSLPRHWFSADGKRLHITLNSDFQPLTAAELERVKKRAREGLEQWRQSLAEDPK